MRILRARYRNGDELLRAYQPSMVGGGLFYPTREALDVGTPLILEVRMPALRGNKVMMRGTVAWRRSGRHRAKLRAGVGIEFHPNETEQREFLLALARGEDLPIVARRHRRLPVDLDVAWRVVEGRDSYPSRLSDIGAGGAFLSTSQVAPPGTEIVVDIVPPGALAPLEIAARVAWVRQKNGEARGLGVEFRWRDAGGARRLRELVRRIESSAPVAAAEA
jgi:Tfp pilus assembly protein PilZ